MAGKAIIWVPGFSGGLAIDQTGDGLSKRIARAYQVKNLGSECTINGRDAKYGDNYPIKVYAISSTCSGVTAPVADIWHFDWEPLILTKASTFSLGTKLVLMFLVLVDGLRRFTFGLFSAQKGLGWREKIQVGYSLLLLLIVAVSLGVTVAAAFGAITTTTGTTNSGTPPAPFTTGFPQTQVPSTTSPLTNNVPVPTTSEIHTTNIVQLPLPLPATNSLALAGMNTGMTNGLPSPPPSVSATANAAQTNATVGGTYSILGVVELTPPKNAPTLPPALTTSGSPVTENWLSQAGKYIPGILLVLFGLSSQTVRERAEQLSTEIVAAYLYLSWDWQGEIITGRLESLVAHLSSEGYTDIEIFSCSIGSIYSLNYLFPTRDIVSVTRGTVDRLVTIGCPHDFITTYWNTYFQKRYAAPKSTFQWDNVYCLTDVFGSNFQTSAQPPQDLGLACANAQSPPLNTPPLRPNSNYLYAPPNYADGVDVMNSVILLGFQAHGIYWGPTYEGEENCLDAVI